MTQNFFLIFQVINSIESLSSRLKIDSGLHRVGVATLDSLQSYDFDLFQVNF